MPKLKWMIAAAFITGPISALFAEPQPQSSGKAFYGQWGVDLAGRAMAVRPGDDFHEYANGAWIAANAIPADRLSNGLSVQLSDRVEQQLKQIVEQGGTTPGERRVADFFASWMDEQRIEALGLSPIEPYVDRVRSVKDRSELIELFASNGFISPIGIGVIPDPADTKRYTTVVGHSGLAMPSRDYYLKQGEQFDRYRSAYRVYVETLLRHAGISNPGARADDVIALEQRIADLHWPIERLRDVKQTYNPQSLAELETLAPDFKWRQFMRLAGLQTPTTVVVGQPDAITGISKLVASEPLETWKAYLLFHLLNTHADYLPKTISTASFDFHQRMLRGVQSQRDRWKRGLTLVNALLGEALGNAYVARHFPAESRVQLDELVANLRAAFADRLQKLDWMDETTRRQALAKLAAFEPRIGHPEKFIDYSSVRVSRVDLLGNVMRASEFAQTFNYAKIGKPVDRTEWQMTPQTINAYYSPLMNQITFPAAILQPPYFDPHADPAVNYGGIGAIIGHELGHGFDDQGRNFDAEGKIRNWWTETAATHFTARASALGDQFDQYEPIAGQRVNGRLTMGENIGDLGGLEMAYAAYRRHVAQKGEPPLIDGLSGDQRFFLAYAQAWRSHLREDALRERLLTDPHSPPKFRTNGIVRNVDAWYAAFDVRPGDAMYLPPDKRVRIW